MAGFSFFRLHAASEGDLPVGLGYNWSAHPNVLFRSLTGEGEGCVVCSSRYGGKSGGCRSTYSRIDKGLLNLPGCSRQVSMVHTWSGWDDNSPAGFRVVEARNFLGFSRASGGAVAQDFRDIVFTGSASR
jgi:hypothetical protein